MFKTLFSKLVSALLLSLCLLAALFFFLLRFSFEAYQDAITQEFNRSLASELILEYLQDGDLSVQTFQDRFNHAMRVNPSVENYLLDAEGGVRAAASPWQKLVRHQIDMAPIIRFLNGSTQLPIRGDNPLDAKRTKIFSAAEVVLEDAGTCYLYVILVGEQYDAVAMRFRKDYILRQTGWIIGAGLICTVLIGFIIFALVTGKLRRLTAAMESFRRSNFNEKILFSTQAEGSNADGDEIDRLGATYNEMVEHITRQFRKLQSSEEERRDLIANVSHDLRTPLAALRGYLETLLIKEGSLSEQERRSYLEIATRQGERLTTLVTRLFELAKLDARQIVLNREAFQLGELVEDVVQKFSLSAKQREVEIRTRILDDDPFVIGDIGLIERVLENLIENALRYTPAGGEVELALTQRDGHMVLAVTDTGVGIADEDLPHIFDRFFRADKNRTSDGGSAGLGLAIVKSILALHGANIEVTSRRGKGTRFSFALATASSAFPG